MSLATPSHVMAIFFSLQLRLCEENSTASREPTDNWSLVSSGLSALANMARDTYIRNRIADDQQWWETAIKFLVGIINRLVRKIIMMIVRKLL